MKISAVWFDFGGVLSPPIDELYRVYQSKTGVSREQMERAMQAVAQPMGVHFLAPIELALLTQRQWAAKMREALAHQNPQIDLSRCEFEHHGEQWFAGHKVNPYMVALALEVKEAGLKAGILSNNVIEWEYSWRTMVGLDQVVDAIVDSCKVQLRKPDPRIFTLAAEKIGRPMDECLLIDDLEENCSAARAAGWHAVLYETAMQTVQEVRKAIGNSSVA